MRKRLDTNGESGQAMTEFALVLPLLAMVLFAVIEFGIVFNNYLTLTDAVRIGSRKAVVSRMEASPVTEAEEAVRAAAGDLADGTELEVTVTPSPPWEPGEDVTVTASYPYRIDILGFGVRTGRISSTTTERVE